MTLRESKMDKRLRKTLAALMAGLQVPRSLSALGVGQQPYDELRSLFRCAGWQTAEEIERDILRWEKKEKECKM